MQVKAIGKEKFGEYATVSTYAKYVFGVSVNIGEENFGEYVAHDSLNSPIFYPTKTFPCSYIIFLRISRLVVVNHEAKKKQYACESSGLPRPLQ